MTTYWMLTNHALTEVFLRISAPVALSPEHLQALLRQVFPNGEIAPSVPNATPGGIASSVEQAAGPNRGQVAPIETTLPPAKPGAATIFVANIAPDGRILITVLQSPSGATYEVSWEPPSKTEALQETPEFLEAERRAEQLVGLLTALIWQHTSGTITDLQDYEIDPSDLIASLE